MGCFLTCAKRREFSGMIHWLTPAIVPPATHPATLRLAPVSLFLGDRGYLEDHSIQRFNSPSYNPMV